MKILLTGANGYIGKRLLPLLLDAGHDVVCIVREKDRFHPEINLLSRIDIIEADLLDGESLKKIPNDISVAYYLVHSMSTSDDYFVKEQNCAKNFRKALANTNVKQVIYLSGIVNEDYLSEHLMSRKNVELELGKGHYQLTTLRAGIIIGSGSASFEIIRDLVEKLPVMVTPVWLKTKCQPISVGDVLKFLIGVILHKEAYNKDYDIGGPDVLSYKEMLLGYASLRKLKRSIFVVPVMTPRLSSYWLYFVTSTSYKLAVALVDSMKIEVVCRNNDLQEILNIKTINYKNALKKTFQKIKSNGLYSSWKDSYISSELKLAIADKIQMPEYGCLIDERRIYVPEMDSCIEKIWRIGGQNGWYYGTWLWNFRGFLDKVFGGVGLRRGRRSSTILKSGDALDFWRVLYANKQEKRLLLYSEMKLPGEAWLQFKIENNYLYQTATFRPLGVWGRLYWYMLLPIHNILFKGLAHRLI
jgi:uncharacterized protein YbjT (DUF2867 family)